MIRDYRYTSKKGHTLNLTLYGADSFGDHPCLIYLHGFKGFKDWGFVPHAGEFFARNGFSFLAFNFSHNGIGADMQSFTELEAFKQNTFSLEVEESMEIIHLLAHTDFFGRYLNHSLGLIGHSRGGGLALLSASENRDVKATCTWSAVSRFDRFSKEDRANWRQQGYREVVNSRTGQVFQMGLDMLNDIEKKGKTKLNILEAVRKLAKPLLIVHGEKDETVPYFEAEELNIFADPMQTKLQLIPQTGHTYGTKHPFEGSNPSFDMVLETTLDFFRKNL
jgi:pimeloyl-ACP methyl ester carboxylesterase